VLIPNVEHMFQINKFMDSTIALINSSLSPSEPRTAGQ